MWLKTFPLNHVGEGRIPTVLVKICNKAIHYILLYVCACTVISTDTIFYKIISLGYYKKRGTTWTGLLLLLFSWQ